MKVGDLVNCHWGASDYSGKEDIDWGISPGIVVSDVRGDWCVDVLVRGERNSYHVSRLESTDESR